MYTMKGGECMADQSSCCQDKSCCCSESIKKEIKIDFLYLDLSVCERCQGTESNLDVAINDVSTVLEAAGFDIQVNKVNIINRELAFAYKFVSSPTIRINGKDIAIEVRESSCKDCGDLCGDDVDCRVWSYEGEEYTEPPKELIINAILKEVYAEHKTVFSEEAMANHYVLPDNLKRFFDSLEKK